MSPATEGRDKGESAVPFLAYAILCVIVGYIGRDSRVGFWGATFLAMLLTPVVAGLAVLLFGGSADAR